MVKWHQDFTFDPCSNDDSITIIVFVDNVTATNGVIMLCPGSHKGPLFSLWQDGVFTGAVNEDIASELEKTAVPCVGKAGGYTYKKEVRPGPPGIVEGPDNKQGNCQRH